MPPIDWAAQQRTLLHRFSGRIAVRDAAGTVTYAEILHGKFYAIHIFFRSNNYFVSVR